MLNKLGQLPSPSFPTHYSQAFYSSMPYNVRSWTVSVKYRNNHPSPTTTARLHFWTSSRT